MQAEFLGITSAPAFREKRASGGRFGGELEQVGKNDPLVWPCGRLFFFFGGGKRNTGGVDSFLFFGGGGGCRALFTKRFKGTPRDQDRKYVWAA